MSVDPVESEPPYQYVGGNVVNFTDPRGLYIHPDLKQLVKDVRWVYSTKGMINCNNTPDDGQHPSDLWGDVFVDFVCEYGPNIRYFGIGDELTRELAQTHIISELFLS